MSIAHAANPSQKPAHPCAGTQFAPVMMMAGGTGLKKEIEEQRGDASQFDALLIVDKHRHGDWEGRIPLWFDRGSQSYVEAYGEAPRAMKIVSDDQEVDF